MKPNTDAVLLVCEDHEFGLVVADRAVAEAQTLANTERVAISIIHPVTSEPFKTIQPLP